VTIGGQTAAVSFAGLAPEFVGVYQINATVPTGVTPGDAQLVITVAGQTLQPASAGAVLPLHWNCGCSNSDRVRGS
jgi:uncharacterized protein (TIGR03437 family)